MLDAIIKTRSTESEQKQESVNPKQGNLGGLPEASLCGSEDEQQKKNWAGNKGAVEHKWHTVEGTS